MSKEELIARLARLSAMAETLRELESEIEQERLALIPESEPKFEAGYSMLTREVGEAAKVAETLSQHPDLIGA